MATSQTPGRPSRLTMSPTAKTSGWPGIVRSGSTEMRPARSTSAPVASARALASGDALGPAVGGADVDAGGVDGGDAGAHAELDAEPFEGLGGPARERVAERG